MESEWRVDNLVVEFNRKGGRTGGLLNEIGEERGRVGC